MALPLLSEAHEVVRQHKARLALYKFLWDAMNEGESCPRPMPGPFGGIRASDHDQYVTERLHMLLGIKKPWWKRWLGL